MSNEQKGVDRETQASASSAGLMASLRRMFDHGVEMVQIRIEQFSLEFEAEKLRIFGALAQSLLALLMAAAALGMFSLCLLLLTPENWRWLTALGLGLFYAVLASKSFQRARRQLSQSGGPFAGTAAELGRDRSAMEP